MTEVWGSGGKTVTTPKRMGNVKISSPSMPAAASRYQMKKTGNYGKAVNYGTGNTPKKMPASFEEKPTKSTSEPKKMTTGNYGKSVNYGTGTTPKKMKKVVAAAERRSETGMRKMGRNPKDAGQSEKQIASKLTRRQAAGKYKGKFVGPDRFKGDIKKIAAWRAAGRPQ